MKNLKIAIMICLFLLWILPVIVTNQNVNAESIRLTNDNYSYSNPQFSYNMKNIYYFSNESDNENDLTLWRMELDKDQKIKYNFTNPTGFSLIIKNNADYRIACWRYDKLFFSDLNGYNQTKIDLPYIIFDICPNGRYVIIRGIDMSSTGLPTFEIYNIEGNVTYLDSTMTGMISYYTDTKLGKFSPDGKLFVVYASSHLDRYSIQYYIIENGTFGNGSEILLNSNITYINFYPDGKKIYYIENGDLWLINLNGKNKTLLLNETWDIEQPNFSRDGKKLVYVMNNQIYLMDMISNINDYDFDGITDDIDKDDDNDGFLDEEEEFLGTDPKDPDDKPLDTDGDGIPDGDEENSQPWMDKDDDNDGHPDTEDDFPKDPDRWEEDEKKKDNTWLIIMIISIIIIAIIIICFVMYRKRMHQLDEITDESKPEKPLKKKDISANKQLRRRKDNKN